jgi:hypothetical protein
MSFLKENPRLKRHRFCYKDRAKIGNLLLLWGIKGFSKAKTTLSENSSGCSAKTSREF